MRLAVLLLTLLVAAVPPCQAGNLAEVENRLLAVEVLRGRYSQTRFVAGLTEPLTSSGTLLLVRNLGLVWAQDQPFSMRYVLTRDAIAQVFPNQPPRIRKKADNEELFKFIGLFARFSDDGSSPLEELFDVGFLQDDSGAWTMTLTPRPERMRKILASVSLQGGDLIDQVDIREANGNRTSIQFSELTTAPSALSQDEKLYFQD